MKYLSVLISAVVIATSFGAAPPAAACNNFVGGICLDKKSEPAKKKKKVRKKKAVTKKKAAPRQKTATQCISMTERAGTLRKRLDRRMFYRFTNSCNRPIKALLISNPCFKPRGHFEDTRSVPRWTTTIPAKGRKTVSIVQAEMLYKARAKGVHGAFFFTNDPKAGRAAYPRWPNRC